MEIGQMRFRVFRPLLLSTLVATGISLPLRAQEPVTRVTRVDPVLGVSFRKIALSRDMNLREQSPVVLPPARGLPARPTTSAKIIVPAAQTIPTRSVLPPSPELLPGALPPGGRELALQPTTFTPYDRYLGSVRAVVANLDVHPGDMTLAVQLMKEGRRFKYCVSDPYRADPPALTEARRGGDCKSKALWLYASLGDGDALFVIGKTQKRARNSHAWVYWRSDERWWILDCTERSEPIAADSISSDRYVPYYSYGRQGTYRHKATRLILTGGLSLKPKPVASTR